MREFKFIVFLFVLLSAHVVAQQLPSCPPQGDDRYGVFPCSTAPTPNPWFLTPTLGEQIGLTMDAQWASITNCGAATEVAGGLSINITMTTVVPAPPMPRTTGMTACDDVLFRISGQDAAGTFVFTIGSNLASWNRNDWILGKYIRTWIASDPEGQLVQYYRYLLAGDARITTPGPSSALVPDCVASFIDIMMHGYIDISCVASGGSSGEENGNGGNGEAGSGGGGSGGSNGTHKASLVLTHYDGCHSHLDVPNNVRNLPVGHADKHVGTTYHLVAPNNFDFSAPLLNPGIALDSSSTSLDAIRTTVSRTVNPQGLPPNQVTRPGPMCLYEMSHTTSVSTQSIDCRCSGSPGPDVRYYDQNLIGNTNCTPSVPWTSTTLVPEIPTGFFQYHLGQWTNAARFDVAAVYALPVLGTILFADPRDPTPLETTHVVFGINTYYGDQDYMSNPDHNLPRLFNGGVVDTLLDFGNSVSDVDYTLVGGPAYTNILWMISL